MSGGAHIIQEIWWRMTSPYGQVVVRGMLWYQLNSLECVPATERILHFIDFCLCNRKESCISRKSKFYLSRKIVNFSFAQKCIESNDRVGKTIFLSVTKFFHHIGAPFGSNIHDGLSGWKKGVQHFFHFCSEKRRKRGKWEKEISLSPLFFWRECRNITSFWYLIFIYHGR